MLNYSFVIADKQISRKDLPIKQFDQILEVIAKKLKIKKDLFFDLSFVDSRKIHQINKQYRKVDRPTDVITFAFRDAKQSVQTPLLGEIYICYSVAKKQAKANKWSIQQEVCLLFIHGILHLFQYDHQTKAEYDRMVKLQNNIIKQINF